MKRSFEAPTRSSRSRARREKEEDRREKQEESRVAQAHQRAVVLMATPQLQALPAVLRSGFLYQYECMKAASTCDDWKALWEEVEDELPDYARVEVTVSGNAHWVEQRGLTQVIGTIGFARQAFNKVNALRVAAKPSKPKRAEAEAALPVWGRDVQCVTVHTWAPNGHNTGGMCIEMGRKSKYRPGNCGFGMVRLNKDLTLWTGIRTWRVYNWEPLWSVETQSR